MHHRGGRRAGALLAIAQATAPKCLCSNLKRIRAGQYSRALDKQRRSYATVHKNEVISQYLLIHTQACKGPNSPASRPARETATNVANGTHVAAARSAAAAPTSGTSCQAGAPTTRTVRTSVRRVPAA